MSSPPCRELTASRRSILLSLFVCCLAVPAARGQAVEEIIKRTIEAQGGEGVFDSLDSLRISGSAWNPEVRDGLFVVEWKKPNLYRTEVKLGSVAVVEGYDGATGWEEKTSGGRRTVRLLEGSDLRRLGADAVWAEPLLRFPKKPQEIRLTGTGKKRHELRITHENGFSEDLVIDAKTDLPKRRTYTKWFSATDYDDVMVSYNNYETRSGFTLPTIVQFWYVKRQAGATLSVRDVVTNPEIPDSRFAPPADQPRTKSVQGRGLELVDPATGNRILLLQPCPSALQSMFLVGGMNTFKVRVVFKDAGTILNREEARQAVRSAVQKVLDTCANSKMLHVIEIIVDAPDSSSPVAEAVFRQGLGTAEGRPGLSMLNYAWAQHTRTRFLEANGVEDLASGSQVVANPFSYEGKSVALAATFLTMETRSVARFQAGGGDLLVFGVPDQRFRSSGQGVLLAGRVLGKRTLPESDVRLSAIDFLDSFFCEDPECLDLLLWHSK